MSKDDVVKDLKVDGDARDVVFGQLLAEYEAFLLKLEEGEVLELSFSRVVGPYALRIVAEYVGSGGGGSDE